MFDIFQKKLLIPSDHHFKELLNDDNLNIFGESDEEYIEKEDEELHPKLDDGESTDENCRIASMS